MPVPSEGVFRPGHSRVGRRVAAGVACALAVVASGVAIRASDGNASNKTPALPVLGQAAIAYHGDLGDPYLLAPVSGHGPAGYVLFGTDDWPAHVPTALSSDLKTWAEGPDALPVDPTWADPDPGNSQTWAPSVLATGDGFALYISVREQASGHHCIAVTFASKPEGPYQDALGQPLVCQRDLGGSIDPSATRPPDGSVHLVWKSDGQPAQLWEQALTPDGLHLIGNRHRLLAATQPWQAGIIENPALLAASAGGWWLFYSGNRYDLAGYATGLAYCPTIAGPCRETSSRPFLAGTETSFAPGGMDFFRDTGGRLWGAFATWSRPARNGRFYCCRPVSIAPVLHS